MIKDLSRQELFSRRAYQVQVQGQFPKHSTAQVPSVDFTNEPAFTDVQVEAREIPFNEIESKQTVEIEKKKQTQFQQQQFVFSFRSQKVVKDIGQSKKYKIYALVLSLVLMVMTTASYLYYKKYSQEKSEKALVTKVRRLVLIGADTKAIIAIPTITRRITTQSAS